MDSPVSPPVFLESSQVFIFSWVLSWWLNLCCYSLAFRGECVGFFGGFFYLSIQLCRCPQRHPGSPATVLLLPVWGDLSSDSRCSQAHKPSLDNTGCIRSSWSSTHCSKSWHPALLLVPASPRFFPAPALL